MRRIHQRVVGRLSQARSRSDRGSVSATGSRGQVRAGWQAGLRAAELAWGLLRLLEYGLRLRGDGWCAGELSPREVHLGHAGIARAPQKPGRYWRQRRRSDTHLRAGHDQGCLTHGVPAKTMALLLEAWGEPRAVAFAVQLADAVRADLVEAGFDRHEVWDGSSDWALRAAGETVLHSVRRRITPVEPSSAALAALRAKSKGRAARTAVKTVWQSRPFVDLLRFRDLPRRGRPQDGSSPG